jgi:hypothetical protein
MAVCRRQGCYAGAERENQLSLCLEEDGVWCRQEDVQA